MTKQFGKPAAHTITMGHAEPDANAQKYRVCNVHIHIVALACAMVGFCFHALMIYEDIKKQRYYRLVRHVPCALLFALVIAGNRLYKPLLYVAYLVLDFLFVVFIIGVEAVRQYRIRTDPDLVAEIKHSIWFFLVIWAIVIAVECLIYFIVYRDWKFVKAVHASPPANIQVLRQHDRTAPAGRA
jgi:hypothetical protein